MYLLSKVVPQNLFFFFFSLLFDKTVSLLTTLYAGPIFPPGAFGLWQTVKYKCKNFSAPAEQFLHDFSP